MSETYIKTASRLGWLLERVENELINSQDQLVGFDFVKKIKNDRLPTKDELLAVFEALRSVKVLKREKSFYKINRSHLKEQLAYCRGARDAVNYGDQHAKTNAVKLCAALPVALNEEVEKALRRNTVDMRASIVDIIGSSNEWIVLVSPFWDKETAEEISEFLSRRLEAGVKVDILGRFEKNDEALTILKQRIGSHNLCQFFSWSQKESKDAFGKQTFHFKAVICDDGARAYLGTANLNRAGLRSRMELGVILEGKTAIQLAQIVKVTLSISRQI